MKLPVEESEFIPCDILDIVRHIRPHNPTVAVRFVEAFKSSVDLLARMPGLGRVRRDMGPWKRARGAWAASASI